MAMFKRILVATDDSSTSDPALGEAIKLARDQRAELRIVTVVDTVTFAADSTTELAAFEDSARLAGDATLERARAAARKAGVEPETTRLEIQTLQDHIADKLARDAQDWKPELIVVAALRLLKAVVMIGVMPRLAAARPERRAQGFRPAHASRRGRARALPPLSFARAAICS